MEDNGMSRRSAPIHHGLRHPSQSTRADASEQHGAANASFLQSLPQPQSTRADTQFRYARTQQHPTANASFLQSLSPPCRPHQYARVSSPLYMSQQGPANVQFLNNLSPYNSYQYALSNVPGSCSVIPTNQHCPSLDHFPDSVSPPYKNVSPNARSSHHSVFAQRVGSASPPFLDSDCSRTIRAENLPAFVSPQSIEVHNETFKYPPLRDPRFEIRLIELQPGLTEDEICCNLISSLPLTQPIYECLSYCWGDSKVSRKICVHYDDQPYQGIFIPKTQNLYVTTNLESALRNLRYANSSRLLWIDAICINQRDVHERAAQVLRMKQIYAQSESVIIWLGERSSQLNNSVAIINELARRFEHDTGIAPLGILGPMGFSLRAEHLEVLKSYDMKDKSSGAARDTYGEVAYFFSQSWFRRVWVLQEVCLAPKATVRIGMLSMHWGSVVLAALWQSYLTKRYLMGPTSYTSVSFDLPNGQSRPESVRMPSMHMDAHQVSNTQSAWSHLPELWLSLMQTAKSGRLPILDLLFRAREFQATDPRDKVFALLGLAAETQYATELPFDQRPNYTKTKSHVYCDFARGIVHDQKSLDILSAVDTFAAKVPWIVGESPSWMPDFDAAIAAIRLFGYPPKYSASKDIGVKLGAKKFQEVLSLSGFRMDTVYTTSPDVLSLRRSLQIHMGDSSRAIHTIWVDFVAGLRPCYSSVVHDEANALKVKPSPYTDGILEAYMLTLTSTGFATGEEEFPKFPLGKVVPSHQITWLFGDFAAYWKKTEPDFASFPAEDRSRLEALSTCGDADRFAVVAGKACHERRFFTTRDGYMGLCPRNTRYGDLVVILYGGRVPFIIRPHPRAYRYYEFVGECYIHGRMFGSAVDERMQNKFSDEIFHLH